MQRKGHWALPEDMDKLHDGIIGYAVDVNLEATAKFENNPEYPLWHGALFSVHGMPIANRSIRCGVARVGPSFCPPEIMPVTR